MQKDNTHPKVVNFSLDILALYLANNGCRFDKQDESQKEICFVLNNEQQQHSVVDSYERTVPVVLLNNGYWLYCGFVFYKKKNNRKDLKHFALHFFDDSKSLFRAEWACLDIPESKKHAQPHWHLDAMINTSAGKVAYNQIPSFDFFQNQRGAEHPLSVNLGRAHFFMNWNLEKEKDSETPYLDFRNEGVFRQWLAVTMRYLDAELQTLVNRTHNS